jgi:hypothetical protein
MVKGVALDSMQMNVSLSLSFLNRFPFLDQTVLRRRQEEPNRQGAKPSSSENARLREKPRPRQVQVLVSNEKTTQSQKKSRRGCPSQRGKFKPKTLNNLNSTIYLSM